MDILSILVSTAVAAETAASEANSSPGINELVKLLVVPFLSALAGMIGAYLGIRIELKKTANQELIKKRLQIFERMAPSLNDILCYFLCVGRWKELQPKQIIKCKRDLDRDVYIYGPLFSREFFESYQRFMRICFSTFQGAGVDAKLRANISYLRTQWGSLWEADWDACFSESAADITDVQREYNEMMAVFAQEIGVARVDREQIYQRSAKWKAAWSWFLRKSHLFKWA